MLTGNGKVLVPKQWGIGYQKCNGNKHDKNVKMHMKIHTKKTQINQINQTKK